MKNTENIEKLFKETFEHFEADVNPQVWTNVQNGINSGLGNAASSAVKFAIGKTIVPIAIGMAVVAGSVLYFSQSENKEKISFSDKQNKTEIALNETTQNIISENKSEGNSSNTQTNKQTASPIHPSSSNDVSNNQTQPASDVSGNKTNSSDDNSDNSNSSSPTEHKYGNATQGDGGIMRYNKYNNNNASASKDNSSSDESESSDESSANTNAETEIERAVTETKPVSGISKVPNIFTPDGNGQNDLFFFEMKNIASVGVAIYSQKTGEIIAKWNSLEGNWNGKSSNGNDAPEGVYFYSIQAIGTDGMVHSKNGFVTLNR